MITRPEPVKLITLTENEAEKLLSATRGCEFGADARERLRLKLQALPHLVQQIRPYAYGKSRPAIADAVDDVLYNFDSHNKQRVAHHLELTPAELTLLLCGYVLGRDA